MGKVEDELRQVMGDHEAISPANVVTWAKRHKGSKLYKMFDRRGLWNDRTAAEAARLDFGRDVIQKYRVKVTAKDGETYRVRALVSLSEERETAAESYCLRSDVISDRARKRALLRDAARDLNSFRRRYADVLTGKQLSTLADLIDALE